MVAESITAGLRCGDCLRLYTYLDRRQGNGTWAVKGVNEVADSLTWLVDTAKKHLRRHLAEVGIVVLDPEPAPTWGNTVVRVVHAPARRRYAELRHVPKIWEPEPRWRKPPKTAEELKGLRANGGCGAPTVRAKEEEATAMNTEEDGMGSATTSERVVRCTTSGGAPHYPEQPNGQCGAPTVPGSIHRSTRSRAVPRERASPKSSARRRMGCSLASRTRSASSSSSTTSSPPRRPCPGRLGTGARWSGRVRNAAGALGVGASSMAGAVRGAPRLRSGCLLAMSCPGCPTSRSACSTSRSTSWARAASAGRRPGPPTARGRSAPGAPNRRSSMTSGVTSRRRGGQDARPTRPELEVLDDHHRIPHQKRRRSGDRTEAMSVLPEVLDDEAPTWGQRSACRGAPIDVFFPLGDDFRLDSSCYERACADCAGCPVQQQCLEAHLNELHGCWGGSSPVERRDLPISEQ